MNTEEEKARIADLKTYTLKSRADGEALNEKMASEAEVDKSQNQQDNYVGNDGFSDEKIEPAEQIPDSKHLITEDDTLYKQLVDHKDVEPQYKNHTDIAALYFGWGWGVPFPKKPGRGFKKRSDTNLKKNCFFDIEGLIDKMEFAVEKLQSISFEDLCKILSHRIGEPIASVKNEGKANEKISLYHPITSISTHLDNFLRDRGVEVVNKDDDKHKSFGDWVEANSFKCIEKMHSNDKGLYQKSPNNPLCSQHTSADNFSNPEICKPADLKDIHNDFGKDPVMSKLFCDVLSADDYQLEKDCKTLIIENKDITAEEAGIKISEQAATLEREVQENFGITLQTEFEGDMNAALITSTYYCLKLLLVMNKEDQNKYIDILQFSHLPISDGKDEILRFVVRVFMKMREVNDGYCGIKQFSSDAEFKRIAKTLQAGRINGGIHKEKDFDMFVPAEIDKVYKRVCQYAFAVARSDEKISQYDKVELTKFGTKRELVVAYRGMLEALKVGGKSDMEAVRNAHSSATLIDPATGKDTTASVHSFPLAASLDGMSDIEKQYMVRSVDEAKIVRTPFPALDYQLRGAGQKVGGIEPGDVLTIAAQSGGGKSFLAADFATVAFQNGLNVLVVTLENRPETFMSRWSQSWNPFGIHDPLLLDDKLKTKGVVITTNGNLFVADCVDTMHPDDIRARKMATQIAMVRASSAHHPDNPGHLLLDPLDGMFANSNMIGERMNAYTRKYNRHIDLLVIDSALQLVTNEENKVFHRHDLVARAVEEIAFLAGMHRVAIVMTHQLNAGGNKAVLKNKIPTRTDLGGSINVLQKSSVIVINAVTPHHTDCSAGLLYLAKSRHGMEGAYIHYMRDLRNGIGVLPDSDRYIGNSDKDEKAVRAQMRKYRDV